MSRIQKPQKGQERFVCTYAQGSAFSYITQIWVDKETGVNYLYQQAGYSGGLTPLLKADGTPVVTPVSRYEE